MLFVKIIGVDVWGRRIRKYAAVAKFGLCKCYYRWYMFCINELRKVNRLITFNIKDKFLYVGERVGSYMWRTKVTKTSKLIVKYQPIVK
jgi:hypothetical protein